MTACNRLHSAGQLCLARDCYLKDANAYLRLLRRYDRLSRENQRLRGLWEKRVSKGGGV